jgi:hypothetical protein
MILLSVVAEFIRPHSYSVLQVRIRTSKHALIDPRVISTHEIALCLVI